MGIVVSYQPEVSRPPRPPHPPPVGLWGLMMLCTQTGQYEAFYSHGLCLETSVRTWLQSENQGAARTRLDPTAEGAKVPVFCLLLRCLCPLPLFLVPTSRKGKRWQGITLLHPENQSPGEVPRSSQDRVASGWLVRGYCINISAFQTVYQSARGKIYFWSVKYRVCPTFKEL